MRVELPDGQWLDVKESLKVKDKRDVHSYSVDGVSSDGMTYRFNIVKHQIATAAVRIVGWSLAEPFPARKAFKDRVAAIEDLDEDLFDAMVTALLVHDQAVEAEADAAKNAIPADAIA